MEITKNDCLRILKEIKDVVFSTVDEYGKPKSRIIDVMIIENEKLYFCTARGKDFYKQLVNDGEVSITGMNSEYKMVRLEGKANKLEDQKEWIDRIFNENPSMNSVYPSDSRYILEAFCIEDAIIEFMDLNVEPINRKSFAIGEKQVKERGYVINEDCIECGICKENCPTKCIEEGVPYFINHNNCLHCGLCYESCPVSAIKRI